MLYHDLRQAASSGYVGFRGVASIHYYKSRATASSLYRCPHGDVAALCLGATGVVSALFHGMRAALSALFECTFHMLGALRRCIANVRAVTRDCFGLIEDYLILRDTVAIYDEINADIYLVPGNHNRAAEVAYYCKRRGKKYVFLAGSDMDYDPVYRIDPGKCDIYGTPGYLMTYAIAEASLHLVQSEQQALCLKNFYGRPSIVVHNPIDLATTFRRNPAPIGILWVGSADDRVRRPSIVLELGRRMPEYSFTVIMVPAVAETYRRCTEIARTLPNVTLVGRIPYHEVEQYYANAKLLISTSAFEGFPNSFLQAAKYGVPIVALKVDPGGMLGRYGCGFTCDGDREQLENNIRLLMSDPDRYAKISMNCLRYVKQNHDKEIVIPQFENALLGLHRRGQRVMIA